MNNYCKCCNQLTENGTKCLTCQRYCNPKYIGEVVSNNESRRVVDWEKSFGNTDIKYCIECWIYKSPCHSCLYKLNGKPIESLKYTTMTYTELQEYSNKYYPGCLDLPDTYSEYLSEDE
jgi:hypothetical protein